MSPSHRFDDTNGIRMHVAEEGEDHSSYSATASQSCGLVSASAPRARCSRLSRRRP